MHFGFWKLPSGGAEMTTLVVRSCGAVAAVILGLLSVAALSATMALAAAVVGNGNAAVALMRP